MIEEVFWYAPGMYYPYWCTAGDIAYNADTDTDMGNMRVEEFRKYFSYAFLITEEQYTARDIDPVSAIEWAKHLKEQKPL